MILRSKPQNKTIAVIIADDIERGMLPRKFLLSVCPAAIVGEAEVSEAEFEDILDEIRRYSWNRLLQFLSIRERTRRECVLFLRRLKLQSPMLEVLLDKAVEYGYLDDRRYAEMVARSAQNTGKSPRLARSQLYRAGVSEDIIESVLREEMPDEKTAEIRRAHISRLWQKYARDARPARYRKTLAALGRLGYSWDEITDDLRILTGDE